MITALAAGILAAHDVRAVSVVPDPVPTPEIRDAAPVIITAYQAIGSSLQFVQLYNTTDTLVSLDGGVLVYTYASTPDQPFTAAATTGLMKPKSHILIAVEGLVQDSAAFSFTDTYNVAETGLGSISFTLGNYIAAGGPSSLKINGSLQQRGKTTTGYSSVTFNELSGPLFADELYMPPQAPQLEIVEVFARAKECSPFSDELNCRDYIKLRVLPGFIDGSQHEYRLRSEGATESVSNTFSLGYASRQGDYLLLRQRDDGQPLALTNSGGYLWLEDIYGEKQYQDTVVSYENASSETFINKSWALDDTDGVWKWSSPQPLGKNVFMEQPLDLPGKVLSVSAECPAGKYRNPDTNRCRSIEEAVSALATCEEGKERNPATNRCRSVLATTASPLAPCESGEERNPSTNRCRKIPAATTVLAPCKVGSERSPDTNRCRKVAVTNSPAISPAAAAMEASGGNAIKNALIITSGLGILGYGVYEWRSELARGLRRVGATRLKK